MKRAEIIKKYGDVPTSVWDVNTKKCKSIFEFGSTMQRKRIDTVTRRYSENKIDKNLVQYFEMSGTSIRGKGQGLSVFPQALTKKVLLFYTQTGDVVLDPFAGHNSRMQVAFSLNRHYVGYDISAAFMEFNEEVARKLMGKKGFFKSGKIVLHKQSSECLIEKNESVDFVFTSPPYYDLEYYGEEDSQLGRCKTYTEFICRIENIILECYRVLKPKKFIVWNVNDFRRKNKFIPYHKDIIECFENVGFKLWDIIILKYANSIGQCFATQIDDRKVTAKTHEYLIVGRKK